MNEIISRLSTALADRYAIDREIGSGGMATVYLAEDLKHHRQVAIKVLRPDLAATLGPERFLREIEVAARLQHPHILPLHDSGEADGFLFYVMPYVEGQSLRDKLEKEGELPIGEAVRILRDVVDALTEAHANGVVHRDIKPENIMLRGRHALVTDFGVAKAVSEATGRAQLTTAGVALGTPAYMAPEQASADPQLDHRVDIYAVGAVAYELLTGRPVFMGTSPQTILVAHMTEQPQPVTEHRDTVPPVLEQLVLRCLEKKPADRFQSAEELLSQLEALATPSGGMTPTDTRPLPGASGHRRWLAPGVVAALVIVVAVVLVRGMATGPLSITTSNINRVTNDRGREFQPAISPDGSEVAYVGGSLENPRLVVRSTIDIGGGGGTRPVGEAGGSHWLPSWTSDGASLRFWACTLGWGGNEIRVGAVGPSVCAWKEVGKHGGSVRVVNVPRNSDSYAWSRDGTRVAFVVWDSIFATAADNGEPELLGVHVARMGQTDAHSLAWSPDGRWIAYASGNSAWRTSANVLNASLWIMDAHGGTTVQVTDDTTMNVSPQWLPDGRHLLFVSNRDGPRAIYVVEVGPDGPRGPPQSVPGASDPHSISIAADGRRLAYAKFSVAQNIWSVPIPRSGSVSIRDAVLLTRGNQIIEQPAVSADGEWIVFESDIRGEFDVHKQRLDGGPQQVVADISGIEFAPDLSPDGTDIAYHTPGGEIFVSADGGTPEQLADFAGFFPDWSPDGLAIAFHSRGPGGVGSGSIWIVVRDRVGMPWSDPRQLADVGCVLPDWAPDGASLVCSRPLRGEAVRVSRGGDVLSRYGPSTTGLQRFFAAQFSHDGSRIYGLTDADGAQGVWWVPANGGRATKVVAFDDPSLSVVGFAVGPAHLYFTISEQESDIWVMDLEW
jgi:Tol biopolymer transport system component